MKTHFIEAHDSSNFNWGKFSICWFEEEEWRRLSAIDGNRMLRSRGWSGEHLLVMDLQTGEGAIFRHGGMASDDLHKHQIWVCPMFEPFLEWLYKQDLSNISALPAVIDLGNVPVSMTGYRRPGPPPQSI